MCQRAQRRFWHIISSASGDHYYSLPGLVEKMMEQIMAQNVLYEDAIEIIESIVYGIGKECDVFGLEIAVAVVA